MFGVRWIEKVQGQNIQETSESDLFLFLFFTGISSRITREFIQGWLTLDSLKKKASRAINRQTTKRKSSFVGLLNVSLN